ncbi:hypothetical protein, partial [Listeria monocytogenes]|uniref:hypothetical protein n=1 Tax=Listeria monocytogenes TaxID=1639 RepID=UPI003F6752E3
LSSRRACLPSPVRGSANRDCRARKYRQTSESSEIGQSPAQNRTMRLSPDRRTASSGLPYRLQAMRHRLAHGGSAHDLP